MRVSARRCITVLLIMLAAISAPSRAQSVVEPAGPRAGTWGAELSYYGFTGVSLLRFTSASTAWLLGADFAAGQTTQDYPDFTGTSRETDALGFVRLSAGRRWYKGDPAVRLRPLVGGGLSGSYYTGSGSRDVLGGAYGEVGASYFFTPHLSLGAAGELRYTWQERRQAVQDRPDYVSSMWSVSGSLVHMKAAVYF